MKPKIQTKDNKSFMILEVSKLLDKQTFDKFGDFRKELFEHIKFYREHFVKYTLKKHGVIYNDSMSKREIRELFNQYFVGIIKDEKSNIDKIYKEGNLIGYWNRNYEYTFTGGRMKVRIEFKVF